ncbi:asparagine synthase (glutamine-hydrolyzing) [Spongiivirga citrea]|uniref:asparagine synthase (glutamine-hydrolyzing) n=1 Tax=Spongiivirga citrea TaxID=1481457 RepID=A0A6M0CI13_9FLAO|nr:asparagine synthase (glutamine-hydrolyzing) [Spongiivirga citrea]NER15574.1 asparagine synthase (glutamine-hydrolyzing) [Spongiivirga citrea]
MCGINGIISTSRNNDELQSGINAMNDLIVHRGPDDDGTFIEQQKNFGIAMGMRRLSIIDLNTGSQPIYSDDGQLVIVFNGEIYNYRELRSFLESDGVKFTTQSDTEVILRMYEKEGTSSFKKLDGMFAFSIFDKRKNKVLIARDFFGEKPLYYIHKNNELLWCSELKSLINQLDKKPEISTSGLNLFFRLTYIPAPFTIYENVHKLEPDHYLSYSIEEQKIEIVPIEETVPIIKKRISKEDAKANVKKLVTESVISRLVADVPVGTFLSGGVDSSIVSLCVAQNTNKEVNTFSIGFTKKSYDETDKAKEVAQLIGSTYNEFIIDENNLREHIDDILLNFDEPFADSSSIPTYMVSNKTSDFVKVALTGDGGDEVFGGYNKYYMGKINRRYTRFVPKFMHRVFLKISDKLLKSKHDAREGIFKIKRLLTAIDYSGNHYWDIISLGFAGNSLSKYLLPDKYDSTPFQYYQKKTGIEKPTSLTDYRIIDKHMSLEGDMLVKVDRTSMLNSLECRAPFLNKKLWNYVNTLPEEYLLNGWDKKHILKEAFKDEFSPGFLDKSKEGFAVPVGDWLRSTLKEELMHFVNDDFLTKQGVFDPEQIQKLVNDHLTGNDQTFKVWSFFCFQKWYSKNYL